MGERIVNPRDFVRKSCHTEYMAADYCNIWQSNVYPAPLSMCWFGVQSGGYFLYLARKDDRFRICSLNVGTTPRNEEERLLLTVSQYPFARTGETITTPAVFVKLFKEIGAAVRRITRNGCKPGIRRLKNRSGSGIWPAGSALL